MVTATTTTTTTATATAVAVGAYSVANIAIAPTTEINTNTTHTQTLANGMDILEKRETTANSMDHAYYDSIIRRKRYRYTRWNYTTNEYASFWNSNSLFSVLTAMTTATTTAASMMRKKAQQWFKRIWFASCVSEWVCLFACLSIYLSSVCFDCGSFCHELHILDWVTVKCKSLFTTSFRAQNVDWTFLFLNQLLIFNRF